MKTQRELLLVGSVQARASGSVTDSVSLFVVVTVFLVMASAASGTSIVFPKFSAPIFQQDRLIFTSPDAKRLLCVGLDGKTLWERKYDVAVLDCTTGHIKMTKKMEVSDYGWIDDLKIYGDQVVWLTHKANRQDFNNTEYVMHFCTIPELREEKTVTLKLIEIAKISFEGEYIISDALYRTACFRLGGEKVWERFQSERTEVINQRIYFSDNERGTTRIGFVEVPTGKETILYSEKVETPER